MRDYWTFVSLIVLVGTQITLSLQAVPTCTKWNNDGHRRSSLVPREVTPSSAQPPRPAPQPYQKNDEAEGEKEKIRSTRGALFGKVKRARRVGELWSLVEELGPLRDEREYTIVISAWGRVRKPDMAIGLLSQMENQGLRPNVITYNAVISACEKGRQWGRACALLDEMPSRGLMPNVVTYSAAISACEKGSQWQKALAILETMQNHGVAPNVVTYSAAISACGKGGQWQKALALLDSMQNQGVQPNVVSYNAAMSACEKAGNWQAVLDLLEQLKNGGNIHTNSFSHNAKIAVLEPSLISYNTAIAACGKHGQLSRVEGLLADMISAGIEPDIATYRTILVACELEAKARQDQHTFPLSSLTTDAQDTPDNHGDRPQEEHVSSSVDPMAMVKRVINDMRERQLTDIPAFKLAIAACEHAGHWETALDLARQRDAATADQKAMRSSSYGGGPRQVYRPT